MRLVKPQTFLVYACAVLSGVALLHTSQNVQKAEMRLRDLEGSYQREEEKIRLLKAEWEALNRPERLERLAKDFLDLVPPDPARLLRDVAEVPEPLLAPEGTGAGQAGDGVSQPVSLSVERPQGALSVSPVERVVPPVIQTQERKPEAKAEKDFGALLHELERKTP